MTAMHEGNAWDDLIEALNFVKDRPSANDISPFHCEHDELTLMVAPRDFTNAEKIYLSNLGFHEGADGDTFRSFRFGSA